MFFLTGFVPPTIDTSLKRRILFFLNILLILVITNVFSILLTFYSQEFFHFDLPEKIDRDRDYSLSSIHNLIIAVIVAPVFEELTFRKGLRFSKNNLVITIAGALFFVLRVVFMIKMMIVIPIIISGVVLLLTYKDRNLFLKLNAFWNNSPRVIFYVSLFLFTFLHLVNYDISLRVLLFSPLLLISQFLSGIVYSYVRLKDSIYASILMHSIDNLLLIVFLNFL